MSCLQASDADELTREDVLAVLLALDPPEAYIPEEDLTANVSGRPPRFPPRRAANRESRAIAKVG